MRSNRRDFIKNISQGAVAMSVMPALISPAEKKSISEKSSTVPIKKVHMVFKTHLDVGYTSSARKITKNLWDWKIPTEVATARTCEKEGIKPVFAYGSWVIWETLQKQKGKKLQEIEKAITDDIITWTAMPFTPQAEYYDPSLYHFMLSISKQLDERFGKKTIAAKTTDVPGQTIAIAPHLAKAGVTFMHTGVNWASKNPEVPSTFIWKHPDGSEIISMYCPDYGHPQGVEGHDEFLGLTFKGDNMDPWTPVEIRDAFLQMKKTYPDAEVTGSSFNNFAASLEKIRKKLPVVTQEIGDTWIYGNASDPLKTSRFRELSRLRNKWIESGDADEKTLEKFSIYLSLVGEHTWGVDHMTYLDDIENISNESFHKLRSRSNFRIMEESWKEQREYMDMAIESLPENLKASANEALMKALPSRPDMTDYISVINTEREIDTPHFKIKIGKNGSIVSLVEKAKHKTWFDEAHPLGKIQYQTFSLNELGKYDQVYWGSSDPIMDNSGFDKNGSEGKMWEPQMKAVLTKSEKNKFSILVEMTMSGQPITKYGAPKTFFAEYTFPVDKPEINISLQWFDKTATRFHEASWFSVIPVSQSTDHWKMEKLDSMLSPLNVISYGSRNLHGIWEKIVCQGKQNLQIETYDACLFSPGKPAVYELHNQIPDMQGGIHFNLHNNMWATNYPAWYDEDAMFRFKISNL